tara:strand:- start:1651 stop:3078 length:1428 start_codon:yes stop_codon:yes gene_type:complete
MSNAQVTVNEIDFCVPAQKFRFEYSTVEKGGFPFVPEFVLRLLNVSSLMPEEVAFFFGFTKKELDEALRPFMDNNDIEYKPDGRVALTLQGCRYFDSGSDEPLLTQVQIYRQSNIFDLLSFTPIAEEEQTSFSSILSLVLEAGADDRSNSEMLARKAFQHHFYDLWKERAARLKIKHADAEIYKISEVRKDRDLWARNSEDFVLNLDTMLVEGKAQSKMANEEAYLQQQANALAQRIGSDNTADVASLATEFKDESTLSALHSEGVNFSTMIAFGGQALSGNERLERRILGSLTIKTNQDILAETLGKHLKAISKEQSCDICELRWVAPVNSFWGSSERYKACLSLLSNAENGVGKKAEKKIINTKLYIPLASDRDFSTARKWRASFRDFDNHLFAFVESRAIAPVEFIVLSNRFALVLYHLIQPDNYPVPVPFGFITENLEKVMEIEKFLNGALSQYTEGLEPRDLGKITEMIG